MGKRRNIFHTKNFDTRKELVMFTERILEIVDTFNWYKHKLRDLTRFTILHDITNALICLKVEIEYLKEELD